MRLLSFLIEKRVMFLSLFLVLISVTLVSGAIKFTSYYDEAHPWIAAGNYNGGKKIIKKTEIITRKVVWPNGSEGYVSIYGSANGLGVGEGTLQPVTIFGNNYSIYQDGDTEVGEKTISGSWKYGDALIRTQIVESVPEDSDETSYPWSANGTVTIIPYIWQETVTEGGAIRFPLSVQGSYSRSGTWKLESDRSTTRAARSGNSGTHTVEHKIYCSTCDASGATADEIGGVEAHEYTECDRSGCGVKYRVCDTAAAELHSTCDGCSEYRCENPRKTHEYVTCPESTGCGKPYWTCGSDASQHTTIVTGGCFHSFPSCMSDDHVWQGSCPSTDGNGNPCTKNGYFICVGHTCQFSGPPAPPEISYNKSSFEVYETLRVTVSKSDLYCANLYIDGVYVMGAYPNSSNKVVLSKTFNSGHLGKTFTVTVNVYYGDDGSESTSQSSMVSVK